MRVPLNQGLLGKEEISWGKRMIMPLYWTIVQLMNLPIVTRDLRDFRTPTIVTLGAEV